MMSAAMSEPAARAGDTERAAAEAPVAAVSRKHRKLFAMALAGLASVAIIAVVGVGDGARGVGELLEGEGSGGASARAARHRDVLQKLLAEVERAGPAAQPVELEEKAAPQKAKPCDASCETRKQEIAARMKALRDQINHDFKAMTSIDALPSPCVPPWGQGVERALELALSPLPGVFGRYLPWPWQHVCMPRPRLPRHLVAGPRPPWRTRALTGAQATSRACSPRALRAHALPHIPRLGRLWTQGRVPAAAAVDQGAGHGGDPAQLK